MAKLLDRSARSGGHRRRPATRGTAAESSSELGKTVAPVHGSDWALVGEHLGTTGKLLPRLIWPARHYRGGSTEDLRSAVMATVAQAI